MRFDWREGRRQCPSCGAWVKIRSGSRWVLLYLALLLLAVLERDYRLHLVSFQYTRGAAIDFLLLIGAIVLYAVAFSRFGKLEITHGPPEKTAEMRTWERRMGIVGVAGVIVIAAFWAMTLWYMRRLDAIIQGLQPHAVREATAKMIEGYAQAADLVIALMVVLLIAALVTIIMYSRARRNRDLEAANEE